MCSLMLFLLPPELRPEPFCISAPACADPQFTVRRSRVRSNSTLPRTGPEQPHSCLPCRCSQVMVSRGNIHEAIEYVKQIEQEVQQAMHIE